MNNINDKLSDNSCTGCGACANTCPFDAITMVMNEKGFYVPFVDKEMCVNCGKCVSVCPVLNPRYVNESEPECYAVCASDSIRKNSSSGGAFGVFAEKILDEKGIVCGAAMGKDNVHTFHKCISDKSDLMNLQKAKYVQSDTGHVYKEIKQYLDRGEKVLFSGCPCQVAGLKNYLDTDYGNLITLDLICHGTPSQKVLKKYIESSEKRLGRIKRIDFRAKDPEGEQNWNRSVTIRLDYENGSEYQERNKSPYLNAFLKLVSINEVCGKCLFARLPRQGDISIGDYWGIEKFDESLNDGRGTSVLLINNKKGAEFLRAVRGKWTKLRKTPIDVAISGNRQIVASSVVNDRQQRFFDILDKYEFNKAVDYGLNRRFDIGYVGWWYGENYGSVLTNFALHEVLTKELGKTVLMLQYPGNNDYNTRAMRFALKHYDMSMSRKLDEYASLNWHCEKFVLGSDQLWNRYCIQDTGYHFFLDFVEKNKIKIAYATSFGHSESFFTDQEKITVSQLMHEFECISVREEDGVEICRNDFGVKAELMIDPVFLCDKKIYDSVAMEADQLCKEPYIFAYILNATEEKREALRALGKKINMKYIVLLDGQAEDKEAQKKLMGDRNVLSEVEIEQWMRLMMEAGFVYTDSFHGTCFALIYHKNFCTIKNKKRGNSRFESLLKMMHLEERLIEEQDIKKNALLLLEQGNIDYEKVDILIRNECKKGMEWLQTAINRDKKSISYDAVIKERIDGLEVKIINLENEIKTLKTGNKDMTIENESKINTSFINKIKKKIKGIKDKETGGDRNA